MDFIKETNRIYAKDENGKIIASCSYAKKWLEKHN